MQVKRDEWYGFVRWLNLIVGLLGFYIYIIGGGHHLLSIGMVNLTVWVFTRRKQMNFLRDYWEQLTAFILLVTILTRMRVDLDVLKEKVKTLFELWNQREKKQNDWRIELIDQSLGPILQLTGKQR